MDAPIGVLNLDFKPYEAPLFTASFPTGSEVKFSARPFHDKTFGDLVSNEHFIGDIENSFFFVRYVDYPKTLDNSAAALDQAIDRGFVIMKAEPDFKVTRGNCGVPLFA